jgi:hypothetical protein
MTFLGGYRMNSVKPKSWFGLLGSVVLAVTFAMTACGGDDGDDGDGNGGSSSGGASTGGTNNGGTTTAGAPARTGLGTGSDTTELRKNTAPSVR